MRRGQELILSIEPTWSFRRFSRRRWLQASLGVGTAIVAAGWFASRVSEKRTVGSSTPTCFVFDAAQSMTLLGLIEAVVPASKENRINQETEVLERFDEEAYFVSPDVKEDIRTAVRILEYLPLIYGKLRRFSGLSLSDRQDVLRQAFQSRFEIPRVVTSSLRLMVLLFYYGHPSSWQAIGYEGPFAKLKPKLSEQRTYFAYLKKAKKP